ncbi:MAG: Gfo/Idh/MocA family oxidoreductase [Phycisphaerae bacterium]|jgi:hypothetical protein|nr:Gfo/Idh/MocA family oxidoreductase [Phycisphaerae bacterium]
MESQSQSKNEKGVNRRSFVKSAAAAPLVFSIVPSSVLAGGRAKAPSEKLNLACVGIGYQGQRMLHTLLKRSDVRVTAVCDPNTETNDYLGWGRAVARTGMPGGRAVGQRIVDAAYRRAKPRAAGPRRGCAPYADFREMLAREKDLDAVQIITPDHLHATIAIAAMKAGKHVAMHKPIANRMYETRLTVQTARKTGLSTHLHAWRESADVYRIRHWINQGAIGPVRQLHRWIYKPIWPQGMTTLPTNTPPPPKGFDWDLWLGPVPHRAYSPEYTHAVYRGWYEFGAGPMADMGLYGLWMDWRILGLGAPTSAEGCASFTCEVRGFHCGTVRNDVSFPHASTVRLGFPAGTDKSPPREVFWYDGGMRPPTPNVLTASRRQLPKQGVMFVGDEGIILAGFFNENPQIHLNKSPGRPAAAPKTPASKIVPLYDEWIGAFRTGAQSRGSFQNAQNVAEAICLGNIAIRTNSRIEWDPKTLKITNNQSANKYVKRSKYRKGWEL